MPKRLLPLILSLALFVPAHAGLFDDDEARKQIAAIRDEHQKKIDDLKDIVDKLDARVSKQLVDLNGQMDQLNQQIANLRGQIEVINFTLDGLQKRQKDLYVDLDQRLRAIEDSHGSASTGENQAKAAQQEAEAATAYDAAYKLYTDGKHKAAADAFATLAKSYPQSQAAPGALFWLGMSAAQTGDIDTAIASWNQLVVTYPDNAKAPDAMRAIATVELQKGDKKAARKTLKDLMTTYPQSDAAKDAAKMLKKM